MVVVRPVASRRSVVLKRGLGVAAVHIGQEAGQCDIADATTDGPGPVKLVRMQISPEAKQNERDAALIDAAGVKGTTTP